MKSIIESFEKNLHEKVTSIEFLPLGISNTNYLINHKYVFRQAKQFRDPFSSISNEQDIENFLQDKNITIPCYAFTDKGEKVTKYIEDGYHLDDKLQNNKFLKRIAAKMLELNSLKYTCERNFDVFERITYYREEAFTEKHPRHDEIISRAKKYYENAKLCLCHNDLSNANILGIGSKLYFLDFGFGGNNLPYFEIFAFLSENNIVDEKKQEIFLNEYYKNHLPKNIFKIKQDFFDLIDLLWYYWGLMMFKNTHNKKYLYYAEKKLHRLNKDETLSI